MTSLIKTVQIAKGVFMPIIGIGTWQITDKNVLREILDTGLQCGYRFIDTAASYGNELTIGELLIELLPKHNLHRSDIFVTSKLPTSAHGAGKAGREALASLNRLGLDYLDLYLVHFPGAQGVQSHEEEKLKELRKGSWLEMENLQKEGKLRAIGVSNYMIKHLKEMSTYASITPAVNQCEYHPRNVCSELVDYCKNNGVHFQAYSSLGTRDGKADLFSEQLVGEISEKYRCSKTQLLLAWSINQGVSVLPKTTNVDHVRSNILACDISMDPIDVERLKLVNRDQHYCWDPRKVQ